MVRIDFNRLRFLVIDDNAHMRRIVRTLLHGFGAREVYEAEDGAAGLDAFTHYVPDIVLTDWAMPIFDGLELAQMIRQPGANANPFVPIIMVTGHTEKARVTAARDAGITEFLAKPISAKAPYQRIVNVVANPRRSSRPRPTSVRTGGATPSRITSAPSAARAARRTSSASSRCSTRPRPSPEFKSIAEMNTPKRAKPDVVTYGDHEIITTPDTRRHPARTIRRRAPRRRWRRSPANSPSGWPTNANGSMPRAARSRKSACPGNQAGAVPVGA